MATKKKANRYRSVQTWNDFHTCFCSGPKIVVGLDTETTGLISDAKPGEIEDNIVQFSGIKYRYDGNGNFDEIERIDMYIKNNNPIPDKVSKKTGIYAIDLIDEPDETEAIVDVDQFLSDTDVIIAYNTPFDIAFIKAMYRRCGLKFPAKNTFDVLAMFRDCVTMYQSEKCNLESAYRYLKLENEEAVHFHNSLDDIIATMKVFIALFDRYKELPQPEDLSSLRIPRIYYHYFWDNPQAHKMSRIYFATDCGLLFYEKFDRSFGVNEKKSDYKLSDLNMEGFIRNVIRYLGVSRLEDLTHLKNPEENKEKA